MRDLAVLFDPGSVAVVGASDDPSKWGHAIARQALRGAARRPVHLVNQRGGSVLGRPTARSLAELGDPIDLAVLAVPAAGFESAVEDALAGGAKAIVGITAGLGETGPVGLARQEAITARIRSAGAVLVGPNCLGMVDNSTELYLSSDAFEPGSVALLSQSGNLALELQLLLARRGLGFSRFVSLGNQADLTVTDLVGDCIAHSRANLGFVGTEAACDWTVRYADISSPLRPKGGIAVPLFNLVYHDAIMTTYSLDDLHGFLNAGVPQIPAREPGAEEMKQIRRMAALHERLALVEMTGHEFLDTNYRRERTTFSDGTTVTVDWDAKSVRIQPDLKER